MTQPFFCCIWQLF